MILILVIIEPLNLGATKKYIDYLLTTDPLLHEKLISGATSNQ